MIGISRFALRVMTAALSAAALLHAFQASADERRTYRDASGRITGSATTQGSRTTYRDASGRLTGSATQSGSRTTYRDASGRIGGSATRSGSGGTSAPRK